MKLYIVRHAIAEERGKKFYSNDDRPLSKPGIRKMQKNAETIGKLIDTPVTIISSPLMRAYHTSEILASTLKKSSTITLSDSLLPEASVENLIRLCSNYSDNDAVLIVGHEPVLSRFISAILHHKGKLFSLKKGSICLIEFNVRLPKNSELLFYIPPKTLRMFAR